MEISELEYNVLVKDQERYKFLCQHMEEPPGEKLKDVTKGMWIKDVPGIMPIGSNCPWVVVYEKINVAIDAAIKDWLHC